MLNILKNTIFLLVFSLLIIRPSYADRDWDYYGSGRDHPYSAYIDRYYYIGYPNYDTIKPDYLNGSIVLKDAPSPVPVGVLTPPVLQPNEFIVDISNVHGGYNAVVIKRSGDGFVGPKGEYYPEFPKTFQLQMKYGN